MASRFAPVSKALALLLVVQAGLVALEMAFGMPLRSCPNSFRAAGTLVSPSSLGIFAAVAMGFCAAFAPDRIARAWPWALAAGLMLASGSGTGLVLLAMLAAWQLRARFAFGARARILGVVAIVALLAALPLLTQRPQLYDSLFSPDGRVAKAASVIENATPAELLAGKGMGAGTNAVANASGAGAKADAFYADSTFTSYLLQFGLAGVAAWLLLLAWAWRFDAVARPFYLVLGVGSLAINITELFPVNFLLGLALAHTLVATGALVPAHDAGAAKRT